MPFKVECGTETYRLVAPDGELGHNVPWGAIASVKYQGELYYCEGNEDADEDEEQLVEKVLTTRAQDGTGGQETSVCYDTAFPGEVEDDEDGDDPDDGEEIEDDEEEEDDEEQESRVA